MKKPISLALAASAALCLPGCATDLGQAGAVLDDLGPALQVVVAQDVQAGLLDPAAAGEVAAYVDIVRQAVQAAGAGGAGCASAGVAGCSAAAERALAFARQVVIEAPIANLLGAAASGRIAGYLEAGQRALLAAKDAAAAGQAQTEQERVAEVMAAVIQVNAVLLTALSRSGAAADAGA